MTRRTRLRHARMLDVTEDTRVRDERPVRKHAEHGNRAIRQTWFEETAVQQMGGGGKLSIRRQICGSGSYVLERYLWG